MNVRSGYQRNFLIFVSEDSGYEAGQKPSGHIKIEVRDGKGRLYASAQNLRPANGRFDYKLYLIHSGDRPAAACAGRLSPGLNKAELDWSFEPDNVAMSGIDIDGFDVAAVLVEYFDRSNDTVVCPLAAYRNRKLEWRNGLQAISKKTAGTVVNKAATAPAMIKTPPASLKTAPAPVPANTVPAAVSTVTAPVTVPVLGPVNAAPAVEIQAACDNGSVIEDTIENPNIVETTGDLAGAEVQIDADQENQADTGNEEIYINNMQAEQSANMQISQKQPAQMQMPQEQAAQMQMPQEQPVYQFTAAPAQIDTNCVYLNANICGAYINNTAGAGNPCNACRMHNPGQPVVTMPTGDVVRLRIELDRFFEPSDPFNSRRSDYIWWRVTNPVNLNNILYQCNIRSPLLFNPAVMMAHYKYRHLIIGIFSHRENKKQYVVCGVPGMNMVDRKPFGDASRWVQVEGSKPRYGAFGYWLVYIDPADGKILNASLE